MRSCAGIQTNYRRDQNSNTGINSLNINTFFFINNKLNVCKLLWNRSNFIISFCLDKPFHFACTECTLAIFCRTGLVSYDNLRRLPNNKMMKSAVRICFNLVRTQLSFDSDNISCWHCYCLGPKCKESKMNVSKVHWSIMVTSRISD